MVLVCMLCHRTEIDRDMYWHIVEDRGLSAHGFCLFFASGLFHHWLEEERIAIFSHRDIRDVIRQAVNKECFICHQSGATITCQEMSCDRSFHLPCAVEGGCVTQYFGLYRSFCSDHRPEQAVQVVPEKDTECLICMESVEDQNTYRTLVCPACKHAWFHRDCIQRQALSAGSSCFRCPLCRDKDAFQVEMLTMGIRIPQRPPSWENLQEFEALMEWHSRCNANECLCPVGREQAEEEGPWQLLLCCSCVAEGTHRRCSNLGTCTTRWECNSCAGPRTTASSASLEHDGPSTASQLGLEPSHISLVSETSSPSSTRELPGGASHRSTAFNSSRNSSTPGPVWVRVGTRLQRRAQTPLRRPRYHCGNSHGLSTNAEPDPSPPPQ